MHEKYAVFVGPYGLKSTTHFTSNVKLLVCLFTTHCCCRHCAGTEIL